MTEINDKQIKSFLLAGKQEIPDKGFSRRIMCQVPSGQRAQQLSDMLSVVCTIACCILFYLSDGISIIWQLIENFITVQAYNWITHGNVQALAITSVVLIGLSIQRIWSMNA